MQRAVKALFLILIGVLLGAIVQPSSVGAEPLYLLDDPDPFFHAPEDIGNYKPGDVVRVRRIDTWMYAGTEGWHVAFRSTNSAGNPIMGMTTVFMPVGITNPPLVSYQAIINSLGVKCNPSRSLFNAELNDAPGMYLPIGRGWAVSIPDHLGPTGAYGAARLGGLVTLDSVRAVKQVTELGLSNAPVVLAGYSGGGMASAWAAALQPSYAPELKLDGVVAGGIPADLEEMARGLGFAPHPGFGLAFAAAMGLEREYPDRLPITSQLNDQGMFLRAFMANECRRFLIFHGLFRSAGDVAGRTDLITSPAALAVLHENSLKYFPDIPKVPMMIWHGLYDGLTPFDAVADTARRYCAAGANLVFSPYDISEHMTCAALGFPAAWEYVEARFRGEPAPTQC
ncbi:lipase family protein [Antrihabitans stalactiti]|uniref:Lipase n=1 Tax=Antrihabitans stalactiti TaxID=2584121 RepID=A0A848KJ00_9NOCA|nr:lipase family protein [Antrihabitans stalactiti]NMN97796.1 lipase [Antrihabitans stalactiti]